MRAIILTGGEGTRLRPYTSILPKPLMPIDNIPILEVVLRQLNYYGINHVTLSVGYLARLIQTYFGDGDNLGIKIDYSKEKEPLGTAGPLSLIKDIKESAVLVMNGDILTDINYEELLLHHEKVNSDMTVATIKRDVPVNLGVIEVNNENMITNWKEKPRFNYIASTGIYVINTKIIECFIGPHKMDIPELIQMLISGNYKVSSFELIGSWLDIGREDDYKLAIESFSKNPTQYIPETTYIS
ncbi:sugar phosphate nucleotidyltransferase [Paraliobacillus sp. X-1268]|uniref:sugar phosphate nucleotidyltransferase n=1 Tax=Paraliobacillus sp. X-1268 TaxID=2213193 RepID=UPI000E3E3F0F|nr:sugar phosphate nucleotidyltransferase [Paraliobacillus sp. X-1268]